MDNEINKQLSLCREAIADKKQELSNDKAFRAYQKNEEKQAITFIRNNM